MIYLCSRFELNISKLDLLKRYNKKQITKFNPKTEVFPGQQILTLCVEFDHMRWGIETAYETLKNRLQLENFTGTKPILLLQDIYSTI